MMLSPNQRIIGVFIVVFQICSHHENYLQLFYAPRIINAVVKYFRYLQVYLELMFCFDIASKLLAIAADLFLVF